MRVCAYGRVAERGPNLALVEGEAITLANHLFGDEPFFQPGKPAMIGTGPLLRLRADFGHRLLAGGAGRWVNDPKTLHGSMVGRPGAGRQ